MRDDFRIGLGRELVAFFDQLFLQAEIVLDDAVVHDHDFSRAVAMGMGVFFGGTSVRGPASVADAVGAVERLLPDGFFQVAQLAFGAADLQACRHRRPPRFLRSRSRDIPAAAGPQ